MIQKRLVPVTEEQWELVNEFNRNILEDFLTNSVELSPATRKNYYSNLRIWFVWVSENLSNKRQIDIKPLEFKRFQNWLSNLNRSYSDICTKRAVVSALNKYIEIYYADEYPMFRNFINSSIKRPAKSFVNEKNPLTKEEFSHLIAELEKKEAWQQIAYLQFTLSSGCRRAESTQLRKDVANAEPVMNKKLLEEYDGDESKVPVFYRTHPIRCKGAGTTGKVRILMFGQEAMDAFKKWLEVRGEDNCEHMFIAEIDGNRVQISETTFNRWCTNIFSPIVGRRFYPHMLRESRATQAALEEGKGLDTIRALLGHESIETTKIYVVNDDGDDVSEMF